MAKNTKVENTATEGTSKLEQLKTYLEESRVEIKKVTWPTRAEVKVTTFAVLILVTLMSIFLGVVDLGLVKVVEAITTMGR